VRFELAFLLSLISNMGSSSLMIISMCLPPPCIAVIVVACFELYLPLSKGGLGAISGKNNTVSSFLS
jgi:hypothetical protein